MNKVLIKDIPLSERPRERLKKYGVESLSDEELLSIILRCGSKDLSVKVLSENILKNFNEISNLRYITVNKLQNIKGIGEVKAITLIASIELGRRVYYRNNKNIISLNNSKKIYDYIKYDLKDKKQEYFYSIYLDSKKQLIDKKLLFMGTLNKSIIHPREIFKYAYLFSASSIICVHNHPSGNVNPSNEDIIFTKSLVEIGVLQGINIIDHIIVGNDTYYSFYENGDI